MYFFFACESLQKPAIANSRTHVTAIRLRICEGDQKPLSLESTSGDRGKPHVPKSWGAHSATQRQRGQLRVLGNSVQGRRPRRRLSCGRYSRSDGLPTPILRSSLVTLAPSSIMAFSHTIAPPCRLAPLCMETCLARMHPSTPP